MDHGEIFVMRYDGTHSEQLTDDQWDEDGRCRQAKKTANAGVTAPHQKGQSGRLVFTEYFASLVMGAITLLFGQVMVYP
jgi:hypothetical protein